MGPDCRVGTLSHPRLQYGNYVLQLDVNFQQTALGLEFRNWNMSPSHVGELFDFWLWGREGEWLFQVMEGETEVENIGGNKMFDITKPVTVTIINRNPIFLAYVNSSLLTYYNSGREHDGPFGLNFTVSDWDDALTETATLEIDNFMVWDLDKIE
jgi:hypothetical protein